MDLVSVHAWEMTAGVAGASRVDLVSVPAWEMAAGVNGASPVDLVFLPVLEKTFLLDMMFSLITLGNTHNTTRCPVPTAFFL